MKFIQALYQKYLIAPEHPYKLRILRRLERHLFPAQGLPFMVEGGFRMFLHPNNAWEYHLMKGKKYQGSLNEFILKNLNPGDCVAIAGISFGLQVLMASKAVGPTGCVIAIEPQPSALIRTRQNICLNDLPDNIRLVCMAVGDGSRIIPMNATSMENTYSGSLVKPPGQTPFYVPMETLCTLLQKLNIGKLDMFLLDVIGFEMPVLTGLQAPYLPAIMTVVVHPWVMKSTQTTFEDYLHQLKQLSYECRTLEGRIPTSPETLRGFQLAASRSGAKPPHWIEPNPTIPPGVWES